MENGIENDERFNWIMNSIVKAIKELDNTMGMLRVAMEARNPSRPTVGGYVWVETDPTVRLYGCPNIKLLMDPDQNLWRVFDCPNLSSARIFPDMEAAIKYMGADTYEKGVRSINKIRLYGCRHTDTYLCLQGHGVDIRDVEQIYAAGVRYGQSRYDKGKDEERCG